jgi:hypothetical protein
MTTPFAEAPMLCGPLRQPRQMLAGQVYDGHRSIHDDDMAAGLGLRAGPIEGPTHFSQFDPLLHHLFGAAWFETGCISAHYQNMVVEGEEVRAFVRLPAPGVGFTQIRAEKRDGTPVLTGTASIGPADRHAGARSEIEQRLARLRPPPQLVILRDLRVGQQGAGNPERVRMGFAQHMGEHYPFTLADKLRVITEPCAWYTAEGGASSPWGRAIIPFEMISVLLGSGVAQAGFRPRGPSVGLFAGQEIRLVHGPLFVDHPYELEREIIALSESARTESSWVRTRVFDGMSRVLVAEMILNSAVLKASYADYARDAQALGRTAE